MLDVLRDNAGVLIILLFVAELVIAAVVVVLFRQWSLLRRNVSILKRGVDGENLTEKVATHTTEINQLSSRLDEQVAQKEYITDVLAGAVQRVAVVRYDAFEDMGGKLSFSIAMLDEDGDGVVLSSIYGRNESRTYAKAVHGGASSHVLTMEEGEAVRRAMCVKPPLIRTRKKRPPKPFDVQAGEVESEGDASVRGEDGSWVM